MERQGPPAHDQGGDRWHALPDLLRRCGQRDNDAWAQLLAVFTRVADRALARFGNLSGLERDDAKDAAWESLYEKVAAVAIRADTDGAVVSFFRTTLTNAAISVWRRRRPSEPHPELLYDRAPSPHQNAQQRAALECAERVIQSWGLEDRLIFTMKLEGVSAVIIKADLERHFRRFIEVGTVNVRFFRLRTQIREECWEVSP